MEKVSTTFKWTWNGVEVKGYRIIGDLKTEYDFYSHFDGEIVSMVKGHPIIKKAENVAIQRLQMGYGVIYKDYIMFENGSVGQKKFHERFNEVKKEYDEYLNGKVTEFILDYHNLPVIKFTLAMFLNNMFSETKVKGKLECYLTKDGVDIVFNEFLKKKKLCKEQELVSA